MDIANKVFVVTGAGNGIGREVALNLLQRGALGVAAVDYRKDFLDETKTLAGVHAERMSMHRIDISVQEQVATLPAEVIMRHGVVDGIVNVAGISQRVQHFSKMSAIECARVIQTNFLGAVDMITSFLPVLLQRPAAQITNVASIRALVPFPDSSIYNASKAALLSFSEGLRAELAETSVGVNVILPGAVLTAIGTNSNVEPPTATQVRAWTHQSWRYPVISAETAALAVIRGIEGNARRIWVGRDANIARLMLRLSPHRWIESVQRRCMELISEPPN